MNIMVVRNGKFCSSLANNGSSMMTGIANILSPPAWQGNFFVKQDLAYEM